MTRAELARLLDHSVLKPEATESYIRAGAELVCSLQIGFYCVQPCWVKTAATSMRALCWTREPIASARRRVP